MSYPSRRSAKTAARKALGNPKAKEGSDFDVYEDGDGFAFKLLNTGGRTHRGIFFGPVKKSRVI